MRLFVGFAALSLVTAITVGMLYVSDAVNTWTGKGTNT